MKSLAVPDISKLLVAACDEVLGLPRLGHHLGKLSIERWFAFELAAALGDRLRDHGWVTVVERGGVTVEGQAR